MSRPVEQPHDGLLVVGEGVLGGLAVVAAVEVDHLHSDTGDARQRGDVDVVRLSEKDNSCSRVL